MTVSVDNRTFETREALFGELAQVFASIGISSDGISSDHAKLLVSAACVASLEPLDEVEREVLRHALRLMQRGSPTSSTEATFQAALTRLGLAGDRWFPRGLPEPLPAWLPQRLVLRARFPIVIDSDFRALLFAIAANPIPGRRYAAHRRAIREELEGQPDGSAYLGALGTIAVHESLQEMRGELLAFSAWRAALWAKVSARVLDDLVPDWRQRERDARAGQPEPGAPVDPDEIADTSLLDRLEAADNQEHAAAVVRELNAKASPVLQRFIEAFLDALERSGDVEECLGLAQRELGLTDGYVRQIRLRLRRSRGL